MTVLSAIETNFVVFFALMSILGLCIGSFLNVVIYRLPIMINNLGRPKFNLYRPSSFCPSCTEPIAFRANISLISFILQKGIALCCGNRIPWRYLIVELMTCSLTLLLAWRLECSLKFFATLPLLWGMIVLSFIDLETFLLPDEITLSLLWVGLFCNLFGIYTTIESAVLGVISGYCLFFGVAFIIEKIKKIECLGRGDYKFLAFLGAWLGWQALPTLLLIACTSGSLFALFQIIVIKRPWDIKVPFGPFLAFGGLATILMTF